MTEEQLETERRLLTTFEEVREAVIDVARCARRSLTIQTPDLEPDIYSDDEFLEVVKQLLLAKRYARMRVLVTDPSRANRNGNKLIQLLRRLSGNMDVRNLRMDYRGTITDAFIIADESTVLYRKDGRRFEGLMGTNEPAVARQHLEAFEQPWADSEFKYDERQGHY